MRKSPFPGMDPYLERYWRSVRQSLVTYTCDALNEMLPPDLRADIAERVISSSPSAAGSRVSDDPEVEWYVEITTLDGSTLITTIEFLSASSKCSGPDRSQYLSSRNEHLNRGVNLVEIDLIRQGERSIPGLDLQLPADTVTPYLVLEQRAIRPGHLAVYPVSLRKRLPVLPIPLRATDLDIAFELQPLIDRAYANGRFPIDYRLNPDPPLTDDDAQWTDQLLRDAGLR